MQLRTARLCLDCEEVHDELHCPLCASDAYTYLSRWVPTPERDRGDRDRDRGRERDRIPTRRPAPPRPPEYDAYRQIVRGPEAAEKGRGRPWVRALVGLGAAGVAGLFVGAQRARGQSKPDE